MLRKVLLRTNIETVLHRKELCSGVCGWLSKETCRLFNCKLKFAGISYERCSFCICAESDMIALERIRGGQDG